MDTENGVGVFPTLFGDKLLFAERSTHRCAVGQESSIRRILCVNLLTGERCWQYPATDMVCRTVCEPALVGECLVFATERGIFALEASTGVERWKRKLTLRHPQIAIVGAGIFLTNDNELIELKATTGEIVQRKKYDVRWLDGRLVENAGSFFLSTSESKILKIDSESLNTQVEYKFPGKWAVGGAPVVIGGKLVCSSYAQYVCCFDIAGGSVIWRSKKHTGSRPGQLLDREQGLFFHSENVNAAKLTALSIESGKKRWVIDVSIQSMSSLDRDTLVAIVRNQEQVYELVTIRKATGEVQPVEAAPHFPMKEETRFGLWDGAGICVSEDYVAAAYCPGEIDVFGPVRNTKNNL